MSNPKASLFSWRLSFSKKVLLYALAVSFVSLLLAASSFISYDIKETRQGLVATLELQADMIATHSLEALIQKKPERAQEMIDAIGSDRFVKGAWVYDHLERLYLSYDPNLIGKTRLDERFLSEGAFFDDNQLTVVRSIEVGPKRLGTIVIQSTLEGVSMRTIHQVTTVLIVMLLSLLLSLLFGMRFQRSLTRPLSALLSTLQEVSKSNNYGLRAPKLSNDDLGVLTEAFNRMLGEVETKTKALKDSQERLHLALWGSNEVLFDWELKNDKVYFDKTFEELFGYQPELAPSNLNTLLAIIHPDDSEDFQQTLEAHMQGESSFFVSEFRIKNRIGVYQWSLARGKIVERDEQGHALRLTGTLGDIHKRKESEEELKLFHKVFASTNEGVVVLDAKLRILQGNTAFSRMTGYDLNEVKGQSFALLLSKQHPETFYTNMYYQLECEKTWVGEINQQRKNGDVFPSSISFNAMEDASNRTLQYVGVFNDLTTHKEKEDKLDFLTHYDPLTQLGNRELLKKGLAKAIDNAFEEKGSFGLMIIGIDNFKIINDTFGHEVGDELLKVCAKRLESLVEDKSHLARIGGDEFAFILPKMSHKEPIEALAVEVLARLTDKFIIGDTEIVAGGCVGVSMYPHDGSQVDAMITNADTAMVHAKKDKRNSYQFFTQEMNEKVTARQQLESMMRKAIERDEFELFYQPKISVDSGRIIGAEALIRWRSKEKGMIGPDKFIPVAEETGLIVPIGDWVFRQACMQGQLWHHLGWDGFSIAVNVSAMQFGQEDFLDKIGKCLHETGFSPQCLDIEITEGAIMSDTEKSIVILESMRNQGMTVSIDDFGTGYSSLSYIKQFPIDTIKIDQSFVRKMDCSAEDLHIVSAVLSMARGLKMKTVAEGVETAEQLEELKVMGCDIIQGYYYSKPLPASEFEAFYNQHHQSLSQRASSA